MSETEEKYHRDLNEVIELQRQRILNGQFATFDQYQRQCGFLDGLRAALDAFESVQFPQASPVGEEL